jgi:hypothetical protein
MDRFIQNRTVFEAEEEDDSHGYTGVAVVVGLGFTGLIIACGVGLVYKCWVRD